MEIFKIGVPMLVYQILCSVAIILTNHEAAVYGDSVVAAVLFILGRTEMIQIFSKNDAEVMRVGAKVLVVRAIDFVGMGYMMVQDFRFMGLGRAKEGGIISMARQGFFFVPIILIFSRIFGLDGVIFSQLAADICSFILIFVLVKK